MRTLLDRFIAICLIASFIVLIQVDYAQEQSSAIVTGAVRGEDGEPLLSASILILDQNGEAKRSITDTQGKFSISLDQEGLYSVYVFFDRPDTKGIDYVPSLWNTYVQMGSTISLTFTLKKGASLYVDGNVRFVESRDAAGYYRFTVTFPDAPPNGNLVTTYGTGTNFAEWFDLDERLVVVPAETRVNIIAFVQESRSGVSDTFTIGGKLGYFKLSQGETLHVDIRQYSLQANLARLEQILDSALSILKDAENAGFLVTVERQNLLDAHSLIKSSLTSLESGLYDESFAKMRGAYISISETVNYLQGLFQISSQSVLLLPFFCVFIASALAYLVTDKERFLDAMMRGGKPLSLSVNQMITVIFYAVLFSSFYFLYPGSRLVSQTSLMIAAVLALILWQVVTVLLLRIPSEKKTEPRSIQVGSAIVIAFFMACRNLRRRKLRALLNLTNIFVLIFGLITFTSISPGYGLVTQPLRPAIPIDALLIRSAARGSGFPFLSLPPSFVTWLTDQQDVTLISPKAENIPSEQPIGSLYTEAGDEILVLGAIGIKPCPELIFTRLHRIVLYGSYLQDNDTLGILVSSNLRKILDIGDKLYGFGKEFSVRGFFDPLFLEKLWDVDGKPFIARYLHPQAGPLPLRGDQVVIFNYDTALTLPNVVISRVNIQLKNPSPTGYSDFARRVTLTMEYQVYISHPDSLQLQLLGPFIEEKGAGLVPFLMVLVILNISTSMLSTVEERKNEVATLSSVGLNPTHIAALFTAEAVVIGFVGGALGYLLGILGYRLVSNTFFGTLLIRQKVSAEWGLIALFLSCSTAILASLVPSIRASMITTPSLMRKWRLSEGKKLRETGQPWVTDLPVKITSRELDPFTAFLLERLREADFASEIRFEDRITQTGPLKRISFKYFDKVSQIPESSNEIVIQPATEDLFEVKLCCITSVLRREETIRKTATDVRKIIFEWSAKTH